MPAEGAEQTAADGNAWLTAPLDQLARHFAAGLAAGRTAADAEREAAAALTEFARRPDVWRRLPLLNAAPAHAWHAGRLARFRGMVQDMFDPEFYLRAYGVRGPGGAVHSGCGRYRDVVGCGPDERLEPALAVTGDRHTLRCVSVPGRTPWVRRAEREAAPAQSADAGEARPAPAAPKRPREDDCQMEEVAAEGAEEADKKFKEDAPARASDPAAPGGRPDPAAAAVTSPPGTNMPLPDDEAMACLVKIYEDEHQLSLNDAVEFVGVLSLDPTLAAVPADAEDAMEADELAAHHPPPSVAPRLHALAWRRLEHGNPLLGPEAAPPAAAEATAARRQVLTVLETALLGDTLAAELLLCHLLSSVYARHDVMALGKFALNLAAVPAAGGLFAGRLFGLLERLTEKALLVPVSLDNMNRMTLVPRKDYRRNVLVSGALQLSSSTHLVLDETALTQGQLDELGVKNVAALGHLITWQKVEYDFDFHKLAYTADVPVLVLSEGRSLLPCDCRLPLEPSRPADQLADQHNALEQYLTPSLLDQIRRYLTQARLLPYSVPERLQATVQQEFVSWRQQAGTQVKAEDLHQLLVLARLLSLSHGRTELTEDVWRHARHLEEQRRQRLDRLGPSPVAA